MLCTLPSFEKRVLTGQGDSFVANVPRPLPTLAVLGIVQVACGESHNAALTIHGRVFTWGRGKYGALGLGTFDSSSWPQHVAALQEPACQVKTLSLVCLQLLVNVMIAAMLCLPHVMLDPKLAPILCLRHDMLCLCILQPWGSYRASTPSAAAAWSAPLCMHNAQLY